MIEETNSERHTLSVLHMQAQELYSCTSDIMLVSWFLIFDRIAWYKLNVVSLLQEFITDI